jgi:hypothetical protein
LKVLVSESPYRGANRAEERRIRRGLKNLVALEKEAFIEKKDVLSGYRGKLFPLAARPRLGAEPLFWADVRHVMISKADDQVRPGCGTAIQSFCHRSAAAMIGSIVDDSREKWTEGSISLTR